MKYENSEYKHAVEQQYWHWATFYETFTTRKPWAPE